MIEYRKALAIDPETSCIHRNLALVYFKAGLPEEAIKEALEGLRYDSSDARGWINLGFYYLKKNDLKNAKNSFEKALEIDNTAEVARSALNKIEKDNRIDSMP